MLLVTTGKIAELLHVDRDRVSYLIRKSGILPVGRAGMIRLYDPAVVEIVGQLLDFRPLRSTDLEMVLSHYPAVIV